MSTVEGRWWLWPVTLLMALAGLAGLISFALRRDLLPSLFMLLWLYGRVRIGLRHRQAWRARQEERAGKG